MNKRRFIEKQNGVIRKSNKQRTLENRLTRLERKMNEKRLSFSPAQLLLTAVDSEYMSYEELAWELVDVCPDNILVSLCKKLGLFEGDEFVDDEVGLWRGENESLRRRRR